MKNDECQMTNVRWRMILLLILGAVGFALLTGCGRMPPAEFWTWSKEDSIQVMKIDSVWKDSLKSWFEENPALSEPITIIPETTRKVLHKSMIDKKLRPAAMPKSFFFPGAGGNFYRTFDSSHTTIESLIVTKDTTITVRLNESFSGHMYIVTDSHVGFIRDTTINNMPFKLYDTVFSANAETETMTIHGWSERYLEVEPVDKTKRDQWVLKKISGGARIGCPDDVTAPTLGGIQLTTNSGRRDTVVLRPDSLHRGIQRLYPRDSILSYTTQDSITLVLNTVVLLGNWYWEPTDVVFFLHVPDPNDPQKSVRKLVKPVLGGSAPFQATFTLPTPGLKQIFVEMVPIAALTEPSADFTTRLWAITLDIKEQP